MTNSVRRLINALILCPFLLVGVVSGEGQAPSTEPLKPGDPAPPLHLAALLQAPEGSKADWGSLQGNLVVIDFWATWCAPCLAEMPHLQELVERFQGKPVRFIAITGEKSVVVTPFLQRRKIPGWVGLDFNRATFESYGVRSIPITVIVDQQGKIITRLRPSAITPELLDDLLAGKALPPEAATVEAATAPPPPREEPAEKPFLNITVKPSKSKSLGWSMARGDFWGTLTLTTALSLFLNIPENHIIVPAELKEAVYEISFVGPDCEYTQSNQFLGQAVTWALRVKTHRETRETEVRILTVPSPAALRLRPNSNTHSHCSSADGILAASAEPFKALVCNIEQVLGIIVVDETHLQDNYDWDVFFDAKQPESLVQALRKDLGLELKPAKRPVEFLIVEKAESAESAH